MYDHILKLASTFSKLAEEDDLSPFDELSESLRFKGLRLPTSEVPPDAPVPKSSNTDFACSKIAKIWSDAEASDIKTLSNVIVKEAFKNKGIALIIHSTLSGARHNTAAKLFISFVLPETVGGKNKYTQDLWDALSLKEKNDLKGEIMRQSQAYWDRVYAETISTFH